MGPTLTSCTYLRACIDETLRLSPPVGTALWREVRAGGALIDGHLIPVGCDVGTPIYSIHHNPAYYPDPFTFLPDRWIVGEGVARAQAAHTPFSIGPRGCIGKGLAMAELGLTMATVLWMLDFRTMPGPDGRLGEGVTGSSSSRWRHREKELQLHDHVTSAKKGPLLQFRPRASLNAPRAIFA
jgi:cytochrome P450